jgi:hypothetical protein
MKVGEDGVDSRLRFVSEHLAAIENDHAAIRLENRTITTDITEAAEKGEFDR